MFLLCGKSPSGAIASVAALLDSSANKSTYKLLCGSYISATLVLPSKVNNHRQQSDKNSWGTVFSVFLPKPNDCTQCCCFQSTPNITIAGTIKGPPNSPRYIRTAMTHHATGTMGTSPSSHQFTPQITIVGAIQGFPNSPRQWRTMPHPTTGIMDTSPPNHQSTPMITITGTIKGLPNSPRYQKTIMHPTI